MIAYQYTADGYYAGETEDYGFLPNNATYVAPEQREGFIPRWNGTAWELVENHKGQEYWPADARWDSQPLTMKDYGPLPEGASLIRPEPTQAELLEQAKAVKYAELEAAMRQNDEKLIRPLANGESEIVASINVSQELNRSLWREVSEATSIEEIKNITPAIAQIFGTANETRYFPSAKRNRR